jgi:hypothetical protein
MRRIGIALLVLGLGLFVLASSQRGGYDTVEGALKTTFSSEERSKKDAWEIGRWVALGGAVIGLVLIVLPGKKT